MHSLLIFAIVWVGILLLAYFVSGRSVGLVMFFAGAATLYTIYPTVFYQSNGHLVVQLTMGIVLAVIGYGLGFSESRLLREAHPIGLIENFVRAEWISLYACCAIALLALGLLLILQPGFYLDLGTYENRIAFQGEKGPLAFLLNQIVVALGVLIVLAWLGRRRKVAIILTLLCTAWAFYSHAKLSLLTAGGAWLGILMVTSWNTKGARRLLLYAFMILPISLFVMMIHSIVRGTGEWGIGQIAALFAFQLINMGVDGVNVGDFDGPFQVLKRTMESSDTVFLFGATYVEQLPVLLPRGLRGNFQDLTEQFAIKEFGSDYVAGLGFAYSPWAEGFANFHVLGFFIEAFFIGWINRFVWKGTRLVQLPVGAAIMLQIVLIVLCQRGYLIGHVKNVIVFVMPLLIFIGIFKLIRDTSAAVQMRTEDFGSPPNRDERNILY